MATPASAAAQSPTALGQPRWFFGMLAEVKASAADTAGRYTLLEITAPPGLETPLHVHYGDDEGFYVLEGSVTILVGDETVELTAGQHAFGPRDVPHRFIVGPDGAHMIWVLAPGGFEDFIDEVSVPAEAPTVPPPSVVPPENAAEIVRRHGMELLAG
jgi:mannose-6-phosphate isomerase-like protein (cupin superfamily)